MWAHPRDLYQDAFKKGYAVATFNISNLETLKGIVAAAENLRSPVMIATSKGEGDFLDFEIAAAMVKIVAQKATIPLGLHLDHGKDFDEIRRAIEVGYLSVHIDASHLPYEKNVEITKQVVTFARAKGVNVEGEIGHIGGSSSLHTSTIDQIIAEEGLTNPTEAWHYADETGIDQLAVAVGNAHGVYAGEPHIDIERLKQIHQGIPKPLVLHGGSGIPEDQLQAAIKQGIAKVNINTEIRMAFSNTLRSYLIENPDQVVPYKIFPPVIHAVQLVVEQKMNMLGSVRRV